MHTQIAPVSAIPSSTEVQQYFYNAIQPQPSRKKTTIYRLSISNSPR